MPHSQVGGSCRMLLRDPTVGFGLTDGIVILAPDQRILHINHVFTQLTGYNAARVIGHHWWEFAAPSCPQDAVQHLRNALTEGSSCSDTLEFLTAYSHTVRCQFTVSQLCSDSQPATCVGILQDLTARPHLQRSSSFSTASQVLQQPISDGTLASLEVGVLVTDPNHPDNVLIYANEGFTRLTGYSSAEAVGRNCRFLQGPETDPAAVQEIGEAIREGRPIIVELLNYRKDGSKWWNQLSITPMKDQTGKLVNFVAVLQDYSDRKAVEAAFQLRDLSRPSALSSLAEGISIADPNLNDCPIVYVNDSFCRMTGYAREDVLHKNCRFLQGPDTSAAAVEQLRAGIRAGREVSVELLNYRKDGQSFWNRLTIMPVRDSAGKLTSLVGVQNDVTELVRRREAERELKQAKVDAEAATEAKSMFLANMSHEIRTPLNGMIATAQMLLATFLTPEQRELAETILDSGNTLLTILGDILDFSKIDHNSMVLETVPLWLRDTLESTMEMAAAEANRRGIELAYSIDPKLSTQRLVGDTTRIRQILNNLVSNAIKFTEHGEVVVRATAQDLPATASPAPNLSSAGEPSALPSIRNAAGSGMCHLHVTVQDTGIGISQEAMGKLFESFRQGHESMTRKYGGTGLGLAISKGLAQRMGGTIWVESTVGMGSTFHFTAALPWATADDPDSPLSSSYALSHGSDSQRSSAEMGYRTSCDMFSNGHHSHLTLSCRNGASGAAEWGELGTHVATHDVEQLRGKKVLVDCSHNATAVQVQELCEELGIIGHQGACGSEEPSEFDMAIVFCERVPQVLKGPWRSTPLVALGAKDKVPVGMQPLVHIVPRPVRQSRLLVALCKAAALLRTSSKSQCIPLNAPSVSLNGATGGPRSILSSDERRRHMASLSEPLRRMSLDNSVLEAKYASRARSSFFEGSFIGASSGVFTGPSSHASSASASSYGLPSSPPRTSNGHNSKGSHGTATPGAVLGSQGSWSAVRLPACIPEDAPAASTTASTAPFPAGGVGLMHAPATGVSCTSTPLINALSDHSAAGSLACRQTAAPGRPPGAQTCASLAPARSTGGTTVEGLTGGLPGCPAGPRAPPESCSQYGGVRILVAEDNKVNQMVIKKVLQRVVPQCQADIVDNGLQVLEALDRKVYDVVLIDIHMPEMDGLEASRHIRQRYPPHEQPRIVALSADTLKALHEKCRAVGIDEFVSKPFRVEDLHRVLRNVHRIQRVISNSPATSAAA